MKRRNNVSKHRLISDGVTTGGHVWSRSGYFYGVTFVLSLSGSTSRMLISTQTYARTHSGSTNLSNGVFGCVTSTSKYKLYIKILEDTKDADYADRIQGLNVSSWFDKSATEAYAC